MYTDGPILAPAGPISAPPGPIPAPPGPIPAPFACQVKLKVNSQLRLFSEVM